MKDNFDRDLEIIKNTNTTFEEDGDYFSDLNFSRKMYNLHKPAEKEREEVLNKMKNNNKKTNRFVKVASVAALVVVALPFTTFGQELYTTIKTAILPSGRIEIVEEKENVDPTGMKRKLPEGYAGNVFDKNGKVLTELTYGEKIYNKDGEEIVRTETDEQSGKTEFFTQSDIDRQEAERRDERSIAEVAKDKLNIKPLVLPENYKYSHSEVFQENKEKTDYVNLFYKTEEGRKIILFERAASDEAGYTTGGSDVKELKIDGVDIIFRDGDTFDFERDGLLVTLMVKDSNYDEVLKVYKDLYVLK